MTLPFPMTLLGVFQAARRTPLPKGLEEAAAGATSEELSHDANPIQGRQPCLSVAGYTLCVYDMWVAHIQYTYIGYKWYAHNAQTINMQCICKHVTHTWSVCVCMWCIYDTRGIYLQCEYMYGLCGVDGTHTYVR